MIESIINDIRRDIINITGCKKPVPERRFHKHDQYLWYCLKTADFRRLMKKFRPRFLELDLKDRLKLAEKLLHEHIGELGHTGIFILSLSVEELNPEHFSLFDSMADDFRSWSHVDTFCAGVVGPVLLNFRKETLSLLEKWNRSPNRFKRRTSVVTFTWQIAESGEFADEALRLCDNLIWDEEDIVRKGVGLALKENMKSAPKRVLSYVKDLRRRGVSSTITLYAIRDLSPQQRKQVLAIRKK